MNDGKMTDLIYELRRMNDAIERGDEQMSNEKLTDLVHELRRMNDGIELLFGFSAADDAQSGLQIAIQELIREDSALQGRAVWAATDNVGQVHLCVRSGFMQPPVCFPVDDLESARHYLGGIRRNSPDAR